MAQIFPKWTNALPAALLFVVLLGGGAVTGFFWYFGSPEYTDVGYQPVQPVDYSHKLHAGDLGMDCRYCHTGVETGPIAGVPPTQTCMNCHTLIKTDSKKLERIRDSWVTGKPVEWVRVNKIPDYAYFDHSPHITAGVGCESCHGDVRSMEKITQVKPLSMGWCLDCHRNPAPNLRPASEITTMNYIPPANQATFAAQQIKDKKIKPPTTCSGCHR